MKQNYSFTAATFFFLLWCLPCTVRAQTAADSSNFISYADKLLIKLNISSQTDKYSLKEQAGPGIKLQANNEYKVFLSLDYEIIGFSYGFSPRLLRANNDDGEKGRSSFTNYKLRLFFGRLLPTISFDKTKGYYVENTGDFVPGWQKGRDPYLQLPSLKNIQWALSAFYVINRNFSFKNLVYQTEWQKKSAGSLVPAFYSDYSRSGFDFNGMQVLQKDINLRLGLGYYYSFIFGRHYYIAPGVVPSLGVRFSRYRAVEKGITTIETTNYFTRYIEGELKLGYNSDKWVAGAGCNLYLSWYNEDRTSVVQNNKFYGIVYFGYRFNTPRPVTRTYDALEKKVGHNGSSNYR